MSLGQVKQLTSNTLTFIDVLKVSVDDSHFRKWITTYIADNRDKLLDSKAFKDAVMANNELAWKLCSLLMSTIGDQEGHAKSHQLLTPNKSPSRRPQK
jgi:hypothetical protein